MSGDETDPSAIRSLAVTAEDLVAAVESRHQRGEPVVLRATPPFSGRMRARIHVPARDDDASVHVDPTALLSESAPAYPRPGETEDALRADPESEYTVERHHERHREALETWRERLLDHVRDRATIETAAGPVTVDVSLLG